MLITFAYFSSVAEVDGANVLSPSIIWTGVTKPSMLTPTICPEYFFKNSFHLLLHGHALNIAKYEYSPLVFLSFVT